ncbi:DUF2642 domain-containing protein [Brevibacillus fulvus]|uniref:DUF2642 domain-containing protein n=1 Tax=Brevibacillus fulvus TaxID=1125967 RepID=A0A938XTX4_9BACL|nr:DUF2642 domain-containing protein [Brevibacillus fulvus]MBM7590423.1 hypothetical protein [Brevibacillus fulvus]
MTFAEELRDLIGSTVEVVTELQVVTGVLTDVQADSLTVQTAGAVGYGYGNGQEVVFQLANVTYVRAV